jgi:hypothetical protein
MINSTLFHANPAPSRVRNYTIEKECTDVLWAIKKYRVYLYGTKLTLVTDHAALVWRMSINEPTGKLARWSLYLQTFEFEIVHRKGAAHLNVDVLSRPVLMVQTRKMAKDGLSNGTSSLPIVRPPQKHVSGL